MKFSIATKIFLAFTATIIVFGTVLVFGVYRTQTTLERVQAVNQTIVPLSLALSDIQTDLKSFSLILNERDPLVLRRTLQVTRLAPSVPDRFRRRMIQTVEFSSDKALSFSVDPSFSNRVLALQEAIEIFSKQSQELTRLVLSDNPEDESKIQESQNQLREHVRRLDAELTALRAELRRATDRSIQQANEFERSSLYTLAAATLGALLVAILLLIAVSLTMRRLTELAEAAKRIGEGDYRPLEKSPTQPNDEIGSLFREFDAMAHSIAERDSELRDQHARLIKTERLATIGRMTSLITHELRNPLSSINLNAEMVYEALLDADDADPELKDHLNTIINEVDRLKDITEQYLVYARLPAPRPEEVNLLELIENMVDFHTWEWQDQGVRVSVTCPEDLHVFVDPGQIRQALLNLVKNAVEASSNESEIAITVESNSDLVTIRIDDQSGGLPDIALEQLFEPFFTTKVSGTGLGLAMTQQIIEEHGGKIGVERTNVGTCFSIQLNKDRS